MIQKLTLKLSVEIDAEDVPDETLESVQNSIAMVSERVEAMIVQSIKRNVPNLKITIGGDEV